jgi:hypothetical protein
LAPSCSVSTIFEKIASFAGSEGCDGEVFQKRVKDIFKTDSLSQAQENIVKQVRSISDNEAPSSIQNPENICIPYTTYSYMKKGGSLFEAKNHSEDLNKAREEINDKCEALVSEKIQPFFCTKDLPEVGFENFKRLVHPSITQSQGAPEATSIAFQHFCSEDSSVGETTDAGQTSIDVSSAISLENREVTDFEKFNSGVKTDYEKFNESVCSLLPKCLDDETKGECRDVIRLRAMLIDNIKLKSTGSGAEEFLKSFSRDPDKTRYDSSILGELSESEFKSSSKLLSYLNQFIINKSDLLKNTDGSDFADQKITKGSTLTKNVNTSLNQATPEEIVARKLAKQEKRDQIFKGLEGRGEESLSFGPTNLDKIENPKLLKSFVGGSIVQDPSFESTSPVAAISPAAQITTPSSPTAPTTENTTDVTNQTIADRLNRDQQRRSDTSTSNNRAPASTTPNFQNYAAPPSSSSKRKGSYSSNSTASVGAGSFNSPGATATQVGNENQIPTSRNTANPVSSFDRYQNAFNTYSNALAGGTPSNQRSPSSEGPTEGQQATQGQGPDDFKNIKTGRAGGAASGKKPLGTFEENGSDSNAGQPFILGKDGKPLKGKLKAPAYVFDMIIPQVIVEKLGIINVILKYNLVGKRFNVLEIDIDNNFILHTYDFSSGGLAYQDSFTNNQYNIARIDILKQIKEIQKTDIDANKTLKMLAGKTKKVKSDTIKYEITKEEIIAKTISPEEVSSILASNL